MIGTREEFLQEVIKSIHTVYPEWQVEPEDEFAVYVEVAGKKGCMNLGNLYDQVQLQREPTQVLIQNLLSEFAMVISTLSKL